MEIDHAIYAVRDFETVARGLWDEFGLAAVPGGKHAGWGTANWIVPLGSSYIELIGVENPDDASRSMLGSHLLSVLREGERFIGWCVRPDRFGDTVARLGLQPTDGSRVRTDGTTLRWRAADPSITMADPSRPFFIEWLVPDELHPGRMEAHHRIQPGGIAWAEVRGDASAVRSWLGDDSLPVRVAPGPPALLAIGVGTADGEIVLR